MTKRVTKQQRAAEIREAVYQLFIETGKESTPEEIADYLDISPSTVLKCINSKPNGGAVPGTRYDERQYHDSRDICRVRAAYSPTMSLLRERLLDANRTRLDLETQNAMLSDDLAAAREAHS